MQDIATKKLAEDPNMAGVVMTITDARVVLTGTVNSAATKAKAEQLVKACSRREISRQSDCRFGLVNRSSQGIRLPWMQ